MLDSLAKIAGLSACPQGDFRIVHDGCVIHVVVHLDNDDDLNGLTLVTAYGAAMPSTAELRAIRPMAIKLRRETMADREARASGLVQSWLAEDEYFDGYVYVDSPPHDSGVLAAVLGPVVRHAACSLLQLRFEEIVIDVDGEVHAYMDGHTAALEDRDNAAQRALEALSTLARELPAVGRLPGRHPSPPLAGIVRELGWIGVVGWGLNVSLVGLAAICFEWLTGKQLGGQGFDLVMLVGFALVCGLAASRLLGALVTKRAKGRSDTLKLRKEAGWAGFTGGSTLVFAAVLTLWLGYQAFLG